MSIFFMEKPLVTIGISFYNCDKYLDFAIRSVLNQTYNKWELLLIDDGSTDGSVELARRFEGDPRISLYVDGKNKGLSSRLNEISYLSKGDYIARMDADDIMHPDRLECQINFLIQNPLVDVVGSGAYSIDKNNLVYGYRKPCAIPEGRKVNALNGCFIHPTIMGKKGWFQKNPYDDQKVRMEDFELWNRTISFSTFFNLDQPLLYYREIGMPYSNKYLITGINMCKYLIREFPNKVSLMNKFLFISKVIGKISIYLIMEKLNYVDYLIKKRSIQIKDKEIQYAHEKFYKAIS